MILAVLGTHPARMRSLEEALSTYGLEHGERVVIQSAAPDPSLGATDHVGIVPPAVLDRLIDEARVVVTHGGPGTIFQVIARGKRPLVVPRDPARGEHVDDHQLRFVEWLGAKRNLWVVRDPRELPSHLDVRADAPDLQAVAVGPSESVIETLRSLIV